MKKESKKFNWEELEDGQVTDWYYVSKLMRTMIPKTFPYFTFKGLKEEIGKDPSYKKKEEEE